MKKVDFIREVAAKGNFTQADTKEFLSALQSVVYEHIKDADGVRIIDGVTLCTVERNPRMGRNPQTGEVISIPGKVVPKCKFGKSIKEVVA